MNIGMLWYDEDPKAELKVKIERAVSYYAKKYGQAPNLCFVHPSMLVEEKNKDHGDIDLRTNRSVLPNYLWIGMNDDPSLREA